MDGGRRRRHIQVSVTASSLAVREAEKGEGDRSPEIQAARPMAAMAARKRHLQGTPAARKRDLQGTQHQRARALWYDFIRHQDQHGGASSLLLPDGTLAKAISPLRPHSEGLQVRGFMQIYFHPKPGGVNPALAAPETKGP